MTVANGHCAEQTRRLRALRQYHSVVAQLTDHDLPDVESTKEDFYASIEEKLPRIKPSVDSVLAALAQLAAFRVNFERGLVSIFDEHYRQHVVAEATQDSSFDESDGSTHTDLIIGRQSLPLNHGVCSVAMEYFRGKRKLDPDEHGNCAETTCVIINDLSENSITSTVPVVKEMPKNLRAYIGVPIKTDSGDIIGVLCVFDSHHKQSTRVEAKRLQGIAKLVVQHLTRLSMAEDHVRAEKLMAGISHFLQGKDSLSNWSQQKDYRETIPPVQAFDNSSTDVGHKLIRHDPAVSSTEPQASVQNKGTALATDLSSSTNSKEADKSHSRSTASETALIFSRGSNLIRECMELDAACFLEVPDYGRYQGTKFRRNRKDNKTDVEESSTYGSDSSMLSDTDYATMLNVVGEGENVNRLDNILCRCLGFSTQQKSDLIIGTSSQQFLTMPVHLLEILRSKYPSGHIFHFGQYENVSSSEEDKLQPPKASKSGISTQNTSRQLSTLFPNARSMIFYPLYDNDRQQIYAGFLGWTTDPMRLLQKHEIVYLSGFSNSIMCEVMRLESLATNKAKSNFISSISHELRSPLHGILAASQYLAESDINHQQAEFVQMVDTCGRTLLDTMNQLLDHAKINSFTERQNSRKPRKPHNSKSSDRGSYSLVTDLNLAVLLEETAAALSASHPSSSSRPRQSSVTNSNNYDSAEPGKHDSRIWLPILMVLEPSSTLNARTEAGSWRRIIMNLVGNSLKYTQHGHIRISLAVKASSTFNSHKNQHVAHLEITDTGQGISDEYLRHRLYTPFAQEDNLSVGAGLGLSLVRQMVSSLRGRMQISSSVGSGTCVNIQIPVEVSTASNMQPSLESATKDIPLHSTFDLFGFDETLSQAPEPYDANAVSQSRSLIAVKECLLQLAQTWHHMRQTDTRPDICIIETAFLALKLDDFDQTDKRLVIVQVGNPVFSDLTVKVQRAKHVYAPQHIGPQWLKRAVTFLLEPDTAITLNMGVENKMNGISTSDEQQSSHCEKPSDSADELPPNRTIPRNNSLKKHDAPTITTSASGLSSLPPIPRSVSTPDPSSLHLTEEDKRHVVLLVDDNDINLRLLTTCAKRMKQIQYLTATNGQEAYDKYCASRQTGIKIDVILLDISMPVMNGFQCARKIRAFEREEDRASDGERKTRIVALTGLASEEARDEIDACGFDMYLRKPASIKMMQKVMLLGALNGQ